VTDEGEFIPSIFNPLQGEDNEVEQLAMDDKDDEEDDRDDKHMPQERMSNDFGQLAIR
jgi:hypothetical protein